MTTSTYTVPADANSGDAIKLVVTDADGETAEDTVYVGGFTILKVEPTTASTNPRGVGYKYLRADFSAALTSLTPSDIEIRGKKDNQLFSVESVVLSSDGTSADMTIAGNSDVAGTRYLRAGDEYVIKITQNGISDSYEFELPDFASDMLVTKVNLKDNKITLGITDRNGAGAAVGEFEVGDVYGENLGSLVGRTVNVGVNSDNELETITVNKDEVVYGVMKYNEKGGTLLTPEAKDYFEDVVTGKKYYLSPGSAATSKIMTTQVINVVDGDDLLDAAGDADHTNLVNGATYSYAKLVLNPNGTVACAVLDDAVLWSQYIRVANVDGTVVTETSANAFDFDGYTIEKDGVYVTPEDLEEDDIVYFEDTYKFAEVYNNVVEGTPSGITSASIKIDGTAYKWQNATSVMGIWNAKYYDADNDNYEDLLGAPDDENVKSQKYLASLDADLGVTAYLNRLGDIVYIDGVVSGTSATTDEYYVTTSAGKGYSMALKDYIQFKVSDGTEQTIEIPVSQIKKFNGVAGKLEHAGAGAAETFDFKFTGTDDDTQDFVATAANAFITTGQLVKLTKDSSDKVIGITFVDVEDADATDVYEPGEGVKNVADIDGKGTVVLKPSSVKVTADNAPTPTVAKLTEDTNIWVHTEKLKEDLSVDKTTVTKTAFGDYTKTTKDILTTTAAMKVFVSGSNVSDILILEDVTKAGVSNAFEIADKSNAEGIVTGYTTKKNADGDKNIVSAIKILTIDNTEIEYEAADESLAEPWEDTYIDLSLDKNTEEIADITSNAWTYQDALPANKTYTKLTQLAFPDGTLVEADTKALVVERKVSNGKTTYTKTTLSQINVSTDPMWVEVHQEYKNKDTGVIYADFIVVQKVTYANIEADLIDSLPVTVTTQTGFDESATSLSFDLSGITAAGINLTGATVGAVTVTGTCASATASLTTSKLTASGNDIHAGDSFAFTITTALGNDIDLTVTAPTAAMTTITAGNVTFTATTGATATLASLSIKDQYGNAMTTGCTIAGVDGYLIATTAGNGTDAKQVTTSTYALVAGYGSLTWANSYSTTGTATEADLSTSFTITDDNTGDYFVGTVTWTDTEAATAAAGVTFGTLQTAE